MKKSVLVFAALLLSLTFVAAQTCEPEISLVNQDPYPAIPGEYVKLVFQVDNLDNPECANFDIELLEKYPLEYDPGAKRIFELDAGFYDRDFGSFLVAPYKVRVDEGALEGDTTLEVSYSYGYEATEFLEQFTFYVEDSRADFELHIDEYSYDTKSMTIEILNIAESDVEALTIEVLKQDSIDVEGTNRVVVGDLDSNEFTTADFDALIKGDKIDVKILYTDQTGARRELMETIEFDSSYFEGTVAKDGFGWPVYVGVVVVLVIIIWWFMRRRKNNNRQRHTKRGSARLS